MNARALWHVATAEARRRMSYRADFWITSVASFGAQLLIAIFLIRALYAGSGGDTLAGLSGRDVMLYYVAAILLGRVVRATESDMGVAGDIYDGGLSRYLVYPSSYATIRYAMQFGALAPYVLQMVLFSAWVPLVWGVPEGLSVASVAMCAGAVLAASVLQFLMILPIQAIAFWADNVWSLMVTYRIAAGLLGGLTLPLEFFPRWARDVLAWLPFRCLFALPVNTLLGRVTPREWLEGMGVTLAWILVVAVAGRWVWKRGSLHYTGVGI